MMKKTLLFIILILGIKSAASAATLTLVHSSTGNIQNVTVAVSSLTATTMNVPSTFTQTGPYIAGVTTPVLNKILTAQGAGFPPIWAYTGKILQIATMTVTSSTSTSLTTFINTHVTKAISPTATNSIILVIVFGNLYHDTAGSATILSVNRGGLPGGTDLSPGGAGFCENTPAGTGTAVQPCFIMAIDVPGTTSSTTYKATMKTAGTGISSYGGGYISVGGMALIEIGQ